MIFFHKVPQSVRGDTPGSSRPKRPDTGGNRGSALVVTLLVVATLVTLTLSLAEDTGLEISLASYSRDRRAAGLASYAGVQAAMASLAADEDLERDSLREAWATFSGPPAGMEPAEDVDVAVAVFDESAKIPVNALVKEDGSIDERTQRQMERLFAALEIPEERLEPLLDWLDADDIERLDGAEHAYYRNRSPPYRCANGPLVTLGQLSLVKGFEDLDLAAYLTLYSDGKININTAPVPVLQSLDDGVDRSLAEAVAAYREREDFAAVQDMKTVPGFPAAVFQKVEPFLTVTSSAFSVESEGRYAGTVVRTSAVVRRLERDVRPVYWRVE